MFLLIVVRMQIFLYLTHFTAICKGNGKNFGVYWRWLSATIFLLPPPSISELSPVSVDSVTFVFIFFFYPFQAPTDFVPPNPHKKINDIFQSLYFTEKKESIQLWTREEDKEHVQNPMRCKKNTKRRFRWKELREVGAMASLPKCIFTQVCWLGSSGCALN